MKTLKIESLREMIESNKIFIESYKDGIINITQTFKIELLMLYLRLNIDILNEISFSNKDKIISLVTTQDYIIDKNNIFYDGEIITFEFLYYLAQTISSEKKKEKESKIIVLPLRKSDDDVKIYKRESVINISDYQRKQVQLTEAEQRYVFCRTGRLRAETMSYISNTERDFDSINEKILSILKGDIKELDHNSILLIYSFISLYPLTIYKNRFPIKYEDLDIPKNSIGLRRMNIDEPLIKDYESSILELEEQKVKMHLKKEEARASGNTIKEILYENMIRELNAQQLEISIALFYARYSKEIYNVNYLEYISAALLDHHIEMSPARNNPVLTMFVIEGNDVSFLTQLHLNTCSSLINNDKILEMINNKKDVAIWIKKP